MTPVNGQDGKTLRRSAKDRSRATAQAWDRLHKTATIGYAPACVRKGTGACVTRLGFSVTA